MKASSAVRKFFTTLTLISSAIFSTMAQDNRIGQFDNHADIGSPKLAGGASYDEAKQEYTISGAGTNMWYGADQFHFVWKPSQGDFILRTRVEFVGKGAIAHRKAGWMIRQSLDPDSPYVDCAEHGDGLTALQLRAGKGSNSFQIPLTISNANVLQLERRGNTYIFSAARDGEPFVSAQTNLDLGGTAFVGLFVCSHTADVVEKAIFRDVRIIKPVKQGFTPYRDFIGSNLEILDVHSGKLEMIYRPPQPIEAPNWTRDGKSLVYNVSGRAEGWGRLERFDLATKKISPINLDFAVRNNNDHVLSFDGKMLGISDQSPSHGGQSRVFTVPLAGGTPKKITALTPSYFHSWSPDDKWLIYTGIRTNKTDIYKMSSDGSGEEIRLTSAEGVNDGSEFTPDGKFIYFNSSRTGKMQIWRMNPDGSDQVQITNDEFNNWFPHISPDGKWIVIISFPADIEAKDHPYYKHVYLRLMPIAGGKPKVIAYLYGGQGTINVPSWSPDSKRIAFVSNSD
jgi:TolB protein